jgi:hypothetical protein
MTEEKKKKSIPFKKFLDKSTNLITIFGIFNALFIYSTTLIGLKSDAAQFLLPTFFLLSALIWYELILFTMKSSDGSWKYFMFYFLSASIEVGLLWYFIDTFAGLLFILLVLVIFFLMVFSLSMLFIRILRKPISRLKETARNNVAALIGLISIIILAFLISIVLPVIKPFSEKVYKKLSEKEIVSSTNAKKE